MRSVAEQLTALFDQLNDEFGRVAMRALSASFWESGEAGPVLLCVTVTRIGGRTLSRVRDEPIPAPGYVVVTRTRGGLKVGWGPVVGAESYRVRLLRRNGSPVRGKRTVSVRGTSAFVATPRFWPRRWYRVAVSGHNRIDGPAAVTKVHPRY
jgi:hypothetical protein